MASNIQSSLYDRLNSVSRALLRPLFSQRKATTAAAIATIGVCIPVLTAYSISSYRGFLALGPGGVPYNVLGWALQGIGQLIAKWDTQSPTPFTNIANRKPLEPYGGDQTFFRFTTGGNVLGEVLSIQVPRRAGERPSVPGYVAPQRQMSQRPVDGEAMHEKMMVFFESLVAKNEGVLALKPSALEGIGTPALWLDKKSSSSSSSPPPSSSSNNNNNNNNSSSSSSSRNTTTSEDLPIFMRKLQGETAHIHPECSSHITLSMADAEEVVRKGWAERHRLSGVGSFLPWSYVLIYAPRDEEEFGVWKEIMKAGVRFVSTAAKREMAVDDVE